MKNTLIWIDEEGQIVQTYQKLHLFDVDIKGGPVLKESRYDPQSNSKLRVSDC